VIKRVLVESWKLLASHRRAPLNRCQYDLTAYVRLTLIASLVTWAAVTQERAGTFQLEQLSNKYTGDHGHAESGKLAKVNCEKADFVHPER